MATTTALWNNATLTPPQGGWGPSGRIFSSPIKSNTNDTKAKVLIQIHELDPDDAASELGNYLLEFVLEESLDDGATWTTVANTFDKIKGTDKAETHVIELSSRINLEAGSVYQIGDALARVSHTQGELQVGAKYRVCGLRTLLGNQNPDLQSIRLSATLQTW